MKNKKSKLTKLFSLFLTCVLIAFVNQANAQIKYVKTVASGLGDGSSWANASDSLQVMIDEANAGGKVVWVAEGVYKPVMNATTIDENTRRVSFVLAYDVAIYGGFPDNGNPSFEDRDWKANLTILSGDLLGDDGPNFTNNSENSYHVVSNILQVLEPTYALLIQPLGRFTGLDGFKISGGNANGLDLFSSGGGIYMEGSSSRGKIKNCTISDNFATKGGGLGLEIGSVNLINCAFIGNKSTSDGGGIHNDNSFMNVNSCYFKDNIAGGDGGGIFSANFSFPPPVTNSVFLGNTANSGGGIFSGSSSTLEAVNCSFSGNVATTSGGALFKDASAFSTTLKNCILWGNSDEVSGSATVTYSIVKQAGGVYPGIGNLNQDPFFVNQPAIGPGNSGDLHVNMNSPAIDVGTGIDAPFIDLDQKRRAIGLGFDMGAYEYGDACSSAIVYVDLNATGLNNGTSWTDAFTDLQSAMIPENICTDGIQVWVAKGIYKPTSGTDRAAYFRLRNNCAVYGGFSGNETTLEERNWTTNICVLSGDLLNDDGPDFANNADNSYHIIFNGDDKVTNSAILDGFTIKGGNSNSFHRAGGGMFNYEASPTVSNCIFSENYAGDGMSAFYGGAGMFNFTYASPIITKCTFSDNHVTHDGAGVYAINNSSVTLDSCDFLNNTAEHDGGGLRFYGNADLSNCTFQSNTAVQDGGGIKSQGILTANNCVFLGNKATLDGGAIQQDFFSLGLTNCVFIGNSSDKGTVHEFITNGAQVINCSFSGNPNVPIYLDQCFNHTVRNSIFWNNNGTIELFNGGVGNQIFSSNTNLEDPLFVSEPPLGLGTVGDLRLQLMSPDIDTGTPSNAPTHDADGKMRPIGAGFDKGAYEYGIDCSTITATFDAKGDGVSWNDPSNWSIDLVPTCQHIVIPTGSNVIVPNNFNAEGLSLLVEQGASVMLENLSTLDIGN